MYGFLLGLFVGFLGGLIFSGWIAHEAFGPGDEADE